MSDICYVIGAGDFFEKNLDIKENDYIIAVDGGFDYLTTLGINADLVIGDFDSVGHTPKHKNVKTFPPKKDDTDMLLALKEGLALGYKTFYIYGGTGGRFEHTFANIQCLAFLSQNHATGFLYDTSCVTTAVTNGEIFFSSEKKGYLSVFSFSNISEGVNIKGLKYELNNFCMESTYPIGISNEFIGAKSKISVSNGTLIIIYGRE